MANKKRPRRPGSTPPGRGQGPAPARPETHRVAAGDFVGVWAGSRRPLGLPATLEAAVDRLRKYSLLEVMNAIGRISAVLHNSKGYEDREVQLRIAGGLFGDATARAIARRLDLMQWRDQRERGPHGPISHYVLVGAPTLMALLQLAVVELPPDGPATGAPLDALGEALLMMGELLDSPAHAPIVVDYNTEEGRRRWVHYLTTVASIPGSDPAPHLIVRAVELFLTNHESLRQHEDFIDLPALFEEATGLTIEAYGLALVTLVGTMYGVNADTVASRGAMLDADMFMGEHLRFTPEQVDRFFTLGGVDAAAFTEMARTHYQRGTLRPAFNLPFEQSPLVRFGSKAVCLSVPLLERRMTMGLYHMLLNARPGPEHREFRNRFMRFVGSVWANYVERSFTRLAEAECVNRSVRPAYRKGKRERRHPVAYFITETSLRAALDAHAAPGADTASLCDGALVIGDTVVLVECKARMFSLAARAGTNQEEFFTRLDEIVVDGAAQLDATLSHFLSGAFRGVGLDPGDVRRVIPLIVSLQDLLLTPGLRNWIDDRIRNAGHFTVQRPGIAVGPVEVFGAGDLEWMELAVEQGGGSMIRLLRERERDPSGPGQTFSTWSVVTGVPHGIGDALLKYHSARFHDLADDAVEFFRAHRTTGEPRDTPRAEGPAHA